MAGFLDQTIFEDSYHYVPEPGWTDAAYTVLRAGKAITTREHRIERSSYPGQDILYCSSGRGHVISEGRTMAVGRNQLVWLANESAHSHWPDEQDPWTVYFVRIDGPNCSALRRKIFGTGETLVSAASPREIQAWFGELFETLRARRADVDMALNHLVSKLMHLAATHLSVSGDSRMPTPLRLVLEQMRHAPQKAWQAEDLSALTGMSPAHIRRLFQKHLQVNPRRWLLRERIMMAQKLLLESGASVGEIAERCGFCDVYHLSREFKRSTGTSPRAWREGEGR